MALIDYVIMPANDYKNVCDAIREKTGKTALIKSGELVDEFNIAVNNGGNNGNSSGKKYAEVTVTNNIAYSAIVDAGSVTAKVMVSLPSDVSYYYNHEYLPEIPADVMAEYPYLMIMRSPARMRIVASTEKAYYHIMEDGSKRITVNSTGLVYRADVNIDAGGWLPVGLGNGTWFGVNGSGGWAVWWSNYDISNGSPNSTEIYFPTSEPQTEKPADATFFYYNGVRLPEIPKNVQENYTHYWIYRNVTNGYYRLICSNVSWYRGGDPIGIRDTATIDDVRYNINDDELATGAGWSEISAGNYYYTYEEDVKYPLWSAQNILEGSATATDIYFYGTLAVPDLK